MSVFEQIRADADNEQRFLEQRQKEIEALKTGDRPRKKRESELRQKAKKAQKFLNAPEWVYFEEYLTDLCIEANINIKSLGLSGKSSEEIGNEAIRLASISDTLSRILEEPKSLIKVLSQGRSNLR